MRKLLIKFPTRSRPEKFLEVLDKYLELMDDKTNYEIVISADIDDLTMYNQPMIDEVNSRKNCTIKFGNSKTKIEAINADMNVCTDWDICLLASDDMVPRIQGYDNIIRQKMTENFPDMDGVVWMNDGKIKPYTALNTITCIGKKRYDEFGYLYEPSYKSLWCDNEFGDVSVMDNKVVYVDEVLIENMSADWNKGVKRDTLLEKNNRYFYTDKANYEKRKRLGFPRS